MNHSPWKLIRTSKYLIKFLKVMMVGWRVKTMPHWDVTESFTYQKYRIQSHVAVLLAFNIYNILSRYCQVKSYRRKDPRMSDPQWSQDEWLFQDWFKRFQNYIQRFLSLIKPEVALQHSFLVCIRLVCHRLLLTITLSITTFLLMYWQEQNTFPKIMFCNVLKSLHQTLTSLKSSI